MDLNRPNRHSIVICASILWVMIATLLIFVNSTMNYESSHRMSGNVINIITDNEEEKEPGELIVRKGAHMIEFAFLGLAVITLTWNIRSRFHKSRFGFSFFYVLAIAVTDEHIQSFSDRTSSTGDIILDFSGALIGFFVGWLIIKVYEKIKQHFKGKARAGG